MRTHLVIGVESPDLLSVSRAFAAACGVEGEGHDSLYLGEYDLFRLPEEVKVKRNHVPQLGGDEDPDDEWDYPEAKQFEVLIVGEDTDRPEYIEALANQMGFVVGIVHREPW